MNSSEEIIIKEKDKVKNEAIISVIVIVIITVLFLVYYAYSSYIGMEQTIYSRIKKFYGSSLSQLSLGLVIVFLVSDVVNSFNNAIMFPIVRSSFPDENIWNKGVELPRGQIMYPGIFLQAIVSFILSVAVMFMVGEFIDRLGSLLKKQYIRKFITGKQITNKKNKQNKNPNNTDIYMNLAYIFIIITFIVLIIWNIIEILDPKEEEVNLNIPQPNQIISSTINNSIRFR